MAEQPTAHTVTVVGVGRVRTTPDTATVSVGISYYEDHPDAALDACARTAQDVITALREQVADAGALQTSLLGQLLALDESAGLAPSLARRRQRAVRCRGDVGGAGGARRA